MKRLRFLFLASVLFLSACMPSLPFLGGGDAAQATANAVAGTLAAQTLEALPTPTLIPPTDTPSPTVTVTATVPPTATFTPLITPTPSATPVGGPPSPPQDSATQTSGESPSITVDTPPANIPKAPLVLSNKAKAPVSLALYGTTTPHGYSVYYEYDFRGTLTITVPTGTYSYVAWVGGKKFNGTFNLSSHKLTMTFYKDKVTVH